MHGPRVWNGRLAVLLLLYIGAGLISVALPEEAGQSGYYDGDGDDAVMESDRVGTLGHGAITQAATPLPVPAPQPLAVPAMPVSPPPLGRSQPPSPRSPPA